MPGTPEVEADDGNSQPQFAMRRWVSAKVSAGPIYYSCGWSQWRDHLTLDTAVKIEMEVIKMVTMPPIEQTAIEVDGHPGVEIVGLQPPFVLITRVFVIDGNILTVSVGGGEDPAILATAKSRRFLDSLRILKKRPPL
jgi:hypothetical protein